MQHMYIFFFQLPTKDIRATSRWQKRSRHIPGSVSSKNTHFSTLMVIRSTGPRMAPPAHKVQCQVFLQIKAFFVVCLSQDMGAYSSVMVSLMVYLWKNTLFRCSKKPKKYYESVPSWCMRWLSGPSTVPIYVGCTQYFLLRSIPPPLHNIPPSLHASHAKTPPPTATP